MVRRWKEIDKKFETYELRFKRWSDWQEEAKKKAQQIRY